MEVEALQREATGVRKTTLICSCSALFGVGGERSENGRKVDGDDNHVGRQDSGDFTLCKGRGESLETTGKTEELDD